MDVIRKIANDVWAGDIEYVLCHDTGRRVYELPADMPDEEVEAVMYREGGATPSNPRPMLKGLFFRVVSIAVVTRRIVEDDFGFKSIHHRLWSIPEGDNFDEKSMLTRFMNRLGETRPQFVGFASHMFDLPTLYQRSMINRVRMPAFCKRPDKPWYDEADYFSKYNAYNVDLLEVIGGGGWGSARPQLSQFARACRIPAKIGGTGADVLPMWNSGNRRPIVDYNECDALTTYLSFIEAAYVNGLLTDDELEIDQTAIRNMLIELAPTKPHIQEFLDAWAKLR